VEVVGNITTKDPQQIANNLLTKARDVAFNNWAKTPFAEAAGRYSGGKLDDITIVVGVIKPKNGPE
jgi:hypothetical protein